MLKVEKFETFNWEGAIRGARNPMNSWDRMDSHFAGDSDFDEEIWGDLMIGPNDMTLLKRLRAGGSDDRKFMRQIFVCCDITAPLYWWKEMEQYKVGTTTDSCSTMHKITAKEFVLEDFSCEHLIKFDPIKNPNDPAIDFSTMEQDPGSNLYSPYGLMTRTVEMLNKCREKYLETKDKTYWYQLIQLLPSSYNQKRTWTGSYENLVNIYHARKNHKLDEWHTFCEAIEQLPYAKELIIGENN